jgi:RimJ/RimL family protein N-acetyltransferase
LCGEGLAVQLAEFIDHHRPALEISEVKYNLILGILGGRKTQGELRLWTLGGPGACAIQTPFYPILLGALAETECHLLADETRALDFPGVVGSDDTARWFVDRAVQLGLDFREPIPLQIQALHGSPQYPGAPGSARPVGADDAARFAEWSLAFLDEAVPHERKPSRQHLESVAGEGRHLFWVVDGRPVSMAGIVRRTRNSAAISGVYTPPLLRGRGYAGSVTAAVVQRVFAEGKKAACLYTDLRNPFSNRCYAKIGFEPVCLCWHIERQLGA